MDGVGNSGWDRQARGEAPSPTAFDGPAVPGRKSGTREEVENIVIVQQFLAALARRDVETLTALLSVNAIHDDLPRGRFAGRVAIATKLRAGFAQLEDFQIELRHIVAADMVVLVERTDHYRLRGRSVILPAMAAFEVSKGVITAWRDYWDLQTVEQTLIGPWAAVRE